MRWHKACTVAALVGLGIFIPGRVAQADDTAVQLGTVVVTDTGTPTALRILPGNTASVDTASLALIGETHPAQVFSVVPGAWVTEGSGQESLMAIRSPLLTGAGACGAFLLLEDGIPVQPAGFCNVNALFWTNIEQARAVEVVRGPGSVRYGSNALNGIANVLSRAPDTGPMRSAGVELGSHDYARARFSARGWDDNRGLRVDANATHDGGFRAESGYDQQKITLRYDYDAGETAGETLLAGTNLDQHTAGYIYGLSAYKNESLRDSNPQTGAFRDAQSWLAAQKWRLHLDGDSELDVTPYARRNRLAFTEHYLPGTPIESSAVNSLGAMLALRTSRDAATHVVYGLDTEYAHGVLTEFQPDAIGGAAGQIRPPGLHYDYAADSRTLAAYLQVTHAWRPDWLFSGGLRAETVRYSYVNFLPAGNVQAGGTSCGADGCLANRPADRRDRFVLLLPKFGVSWLAGDEQTLYFNFGRGARAPQAAELYELQRQQSVADLQSETLNAVEFGWRGQRGRWDWDADLYAMLKQHFIFRDANGFNISDGRIRSRGLEFSLSWQLDAAWTLLADGSYSLHRYAFSADLGQGNAITYGNEVKYAPRSLGSLRLRWQGSRATRAELQWTHVGGYFLDEADQHRYGGHDLLNLSIEQALPRGWTLSLRVLNLADTAYAERADYSFGNYRYFPGDGRQGFVGVEKTF